MNVKGLSEAKIEKIVSVARTMRVCISLLCMRVDNWYFLHRKRDDEHASGRICSIDEPLLWSFLDGEEGLENHYGKLGVG